MLILQSVLSTCAPSLQTSLLATARVSLVLAASLACVATPPHAAHAQSCTGSWLFHAPDQQRPGIDLFNNRSPSCVVAWDPDGAGPEQEWTVVGGSIDRAGNTPVANIAAYDGTQWRALGAGFNQRVQALAVINGELHAAGGFTASGTTPINFVARWNGTAWQPLGAGPGGQVIAMTAWNNQVVVAIPQAFGAGDIKTWNGTAWVNVGPTGSSARALAVYAGQLVAARGTGSANGQVTVWNGSTWTNLGSGFTNGSSAGTPSALAVAGGDLYAAGTFTTAGGVPANGIARWNGTTWSALGSGINSTVNAIEVLGTEVFAGGSFSNAGGVTVSNVARWNGTSWSSPSSGIVQTGSPVDMAVVRGQITIVGNFTHWENQTSIPGIATWNSTEQLWQAVSSSFDAQVSGFREVQGALYAYGRFTRAGGNEAISLAKWDGLAWQPVGNYPLRFTDVVTEYNGQLVAAGSRRNADGSFTRRIIRFDGSQWLAMDAANDASSDFVGVIQAAIVYNGDLYVSGRFTNAGGVAASGIARWNGTTWSPLQQGLTGVFGSQSSILAPALAVYNNELYVGGAFVNAGSITNVNHVARWNGTTWSRAGTLNGYSSFAFVSALQVFQGQLYATGNAILNTGQEIARWNGMTWSALPGGGLAGSDNAGSVGGRAMCVLNNKLYVGGVFSSAGGTTSYKIARYTGTAWETFANQGLGSNAGSRDNIFGLGVFRGEVLVGGRFPAVGSGAGTGSGNFARFTDTNIPWIAQQPQDTSSCAGNTVQLTAASATGYTNVSYRWQIETAFPSDSFIDLTSNVLPGIGTVSGENSQTVSIDILPSDSGFRIYRVRMIASNACGQTPSDPATLFIAETPVIEQQPASAFSCPQALDAGVSLSIVPGPSGVPFNLVWQIEDAAAPSGWRTLEEELDPAPLVLPNGQTCGLYAYAPQQTLALTQLCPDIAATRFRALVSNECGQSASQPATVSVSTCDCIDFNADSLFPDDADLIDFLSVLAGAPCSTNACSDIDFNNDGLFPDDNDLIAFLTVLAGGGC